MNVCKIFSTIAFLIFAFISKAQNFHNLKFEQLCDSSKSGLCYWDLSWGKKANIRQDNIDNNDCLQLKGDLKTEVAFVEQSSSFAHFKELEIITVSAWIRCENVEGKGAGLNINVYDGDGQLSVFKDMGDFYSIDWIRGTRNWKQYAISLVCPTGTAKIKIGAILYGNGKTWFKNYSVTVTPVSNRKASPLAIKFISSACDTIKKHSLYRDSMDINKIKTAALQIAGNAKKYSDCYLAIDYLVESLREYGDYHSFFMKAAAVENWKNGGSQVSKIEFPSWKIIDNCGYILVPPFHAGNPKLILQYADSLQSAIKQLQASNIKGWLIDLRQNTGGNMEPMIAGLGPLFSAEKLGSLIDIKNKSVAWYYKDGKYFTDDDKGWKVSRPVGSTEKLPIAVMTSNLVGSSGEIIVISFIGNDKTKSFGQPTMGLTTGNGSFDLADGSKMFIASTIMADRNGRKYNGSIRPDVVIDPKVVDKEDAVIAKAIEWIKGQ